MDKTHFADYTKLASHRHCADCTKSASSRVSAWLRKLFVITLSLIASVNIFCAELRMLVELVS